MSKNTNAILAEALKDIVNAADSSKPFTAEELKTSFADAINLASRVEVGEVEDAPIDPHNVALTAVAMFDGARATDLFQKWEQHEAGGVVELYDHFASMAERSETVLKKLGITNFPGVYEYEVSSVYGGWFYGELMNGVPTDEAANLALGKFISAFFLKGDDGGLTQEQRKILQDETGFATPEAPKKIEGLNQPHVVICGDNAFGPFEGESAAHEYAALKLEETDDYKVLPLI